MLADHAPLLLIPYIFYSLACHPHQTRYAHAALPRLLPSVEIKGRRTKGLACPLISGPYGTCNHDEPSICIRIRLAASSTLDLCRDGSPPTRLHFSQYEIVASSFRRSIYSEASRRP
jgi:hypothetical protein